VNNEAAALAAVHNPNFNPLNQTVVEGVSPQVPPSSEQPPVHVVDYGNNRVELEVNSPSPNLLVTSETLYPGWTATVNGRPVAFRGIPLSAGENHIVMTYFPRH
jgi:hypothetical protein